MTKEQIKFHTIKYVMGIGNIPKDYVGVVQNIMCDNLGIEKTEENFSTIKEGVETYFNTINSMYFTD
jgi:hypothetical protein